MSLSRYCHTHGPYEEYGRGCPSCRDAEEMVTGALAYLVEKSSRGPNYGSYECPKCRYRTLQSGAERCPACRADVPSGHWPRIWQAEHEQRERVRELEKEATEAAARRREELSSHWLVQYGGRIALVLCAVWLGVAFLAVATDNKDSCAVELIIFVCFWSAIAILIGKAMKSSSLGRRPT